MVNPEVLVIVFKLTANHTAWPYGRSESLRPGVLLKKAKVQSPYCLICLLLFPGLNLCFNLASHGQNCSLDLPLEQVRECG